MTYQENFGRLEVMFNLYVEKKQVYGVDRFYPACEKSKILGNISGNKTLLPDVIGKLKTLGYTFNQIEVKI